MILSKDQAITQEDLTTHSLNSQNDKHRVLIGSYVFGRSMTLLPRFRLWVESCRSAGDRFDFVLIGDTKPPFELPPRMVHYHVTWPDLVGRVEALLAGAH